MVKFRKRVLFNNVVNDLQNAEVCDATDVEFFDAAGNTIINVYA
ncbi:MAG TPA: hypothetical protein VEZ55_07180 [Chitinophagaceae bacterium]|nr:hypothetical protein [Chitinophagaceae bacterium]